MPNMHWSKLSKLQLGKYGEYYAKMEFASYGFDVYTSEVDDHGVDFVVKDPNSFKFYEVQVKSMRNAGYVFLLKSKMSLNPNRLVCLLCFTDNALPEVYIIPATAWQTPNSLLSSKDYGKEGQTSAPEWGINISKKNMPLLKAFSAHTFFDSFAIHPE